MGQRNTPREHVVVVGETPEANVTQSGQIAKQRYEAREAAETAIDGMVVPTTSLDRPTTGPEPAGRPRTRFRSRATQQGRGAGRGEGLLSSSFRVQK